MHKYIALCLIAIIISFVSVRLFCVKGGIFYRAMNRLTGLAIGTSCLLIWGVVIEIVKKQEHLKELRKTPRRKELDRITGL